MEIPTSFLIHPLSLSMDVGEEKRQSQQHISLMFTEIEAWSLKNSNAYFPLIYINQPIKGCTYQLPFLFLYILSSSKQKLAAAVLFYSGCVY